MRMLILSSKEGLQKEVGNISKIELAIKEFIRIKKDYDIRFCYYDQPNRYRVKPVKKNAMAIRDFIANLEVKWGEIYILVLIGGDRIIPFHKLKNPCDDNDRVVLSDNPYASRDDDFLIPERVCARIPDNHDVNFIINQLKKTHNITKASFGMTAKVWKEASKNVYRQIGKPNDLKVSPPITLDNFKSNWLENKDLLYFNLHGSDVSPNWYGQDGDEYPIALSPLNIQDATGVVASEACYGAYIINKSNKNTICLKFLNQENVLGFCGSTTIAYGPPAPPSTEADLLVKYFFEYLKHGMTLGESLKNAKIDIARKALRRHGFLDDDDQKTLLQFVLYGDPTLRLI